MGTVERERSPGRISNWLDEAREGRAAALDALAPIVYAELHRLARAYMRRERVNHTLQATALVHEAYLRLVRDPGVGWDSRRHFLPAAAEAMRRILIERARRRKVLAKGGFVTPEELTESKLVVQAPDDELLDVHAAVDRLAAEDAMAAELVKLRYFLGLSMPEAAEILDLPLRSAERLWTFARAWLRHELEQSRT